MVRLAIRSCPRRRRKSRSGVAAAALLLSFGTAAIAGADLIEYSWSGYIEPSGDDNPWALAGDGSALTTQDGTEFELEVYVDEAAVDLDGAGNPGYARYEAVLARLVVGDLLAEVQLPEIDFGDDAFEGLFDDVGFSAGVERLETALPFRASVRVAPSTFELAWPAAPDPPPLFASTLPTQIGGFGQSEFVTLPALAPVRAARIPWLAFPAATAVEWTGPTEGLAGDISIAMTGAEDAAPTFADLSGTAYGAAASYWRTSALGYDAGSHWTATFSAPVATVLLYLRSWRGLGAELGPVTYHFDVPFTIRSGLEAASILGNAGGLSLVLPETGFHDGVLQFDGPISSLALTPSTDSSSGQALAMAVVTLDPGAGANWTTPQSAMAGGIGVALQGVDAPSVETRDLSGSPFAPAPRGPAAEVVAFDASADWTLALTEPAAGLLLYAHQWQSSAMTPPSYVFDSPFTILAGFDGGRVEHTTLTLTASEPQSGILFFRGPIASLSVESDADPGPAHELTLALLPEPRVGEVMGVVPGDRAEAEADNGTRLPVDSLADSVRLQQIYAAEELASLGASFCIRELAFRTDGEPESGFPFGPVSVDVRLALSTSPRTVETLSTAFAENVGADARVVIDGPVTIASGFVGPAGGPKAFDVRFPFERPFCYEPAEGDLLADFRVSETVAISNLDADSRIGVRLNTVFTANDGTVDDPTGTLLRFGLVTRFTVPEPGAGAAGASALTVLVFLGRRARARGTRLAVMP